eukprot:359407-Chlamydomonas_euryale.AAC.1
MRERDRWRCRGLARCRASTRRECGDGGWGIVEEEGRVAGMGYGGGRGKGGGHGVWRRKREGWRGCSDEAGMAGCVRGGEEGRGREEAGRMRGAVWVDGAWAGLGRGAWARRMGAAHGRGAWAPQRLRDEQHGRAGRRRRVGRRGAAAARRSARHERRRGEGAGLPVGRAVRWRARHNADAAVKVVSGDDSAFLVLAGTRCSC